MIGHNVATRATRLVKSLIRLDHFVYRHAGGVIYIVVLCMTYPCQVNFVNSHLQREREKFLHIPVQIYDL